MNGKNGGGAILIYANTASHTGTISVNGNSGNADAGAGAGGSILIYGDELDFTTLSAEGGNQANGDGGNGRIAIYYLTSYAIENSDPNPGYVGYLGPGTLTPTPSPTVTPTGVTGWQARQYVYNGLQPHAVDSIQRPGGTDTFTYDDNGNMITRVEGGVTWAQTFNGENRLASITNTTANPDETWTFVYDGDGNRIKQVGPTGTVTLFLGGGIYTVVNPGASQEVTKYYAIAGQRVAMENGDGLQYLLTDHLGSVIAVLDNEGELVSEQRYMPFGAERLDPNILQTDFGFTGQRDLAATGLMDYNARWYGTNFGRFVQPDTKLAGSSQSQALNHYSYAANNPMRFADSGGECPTPTNWQAETAYIVCVDLFISTETILPFGVGYGDGREFDSNSDEGDSRAYLYLYLNSQGNLIDQDSQTSQSCLKIGCFGPYSGNQFSANQNAETGDISVNWNLTNGVSGVIYETIRGYGWNGPEAPGVALLQLGADSIPSIDGSLTLSTAPGGTLELQNLNRDPYPSLEVYLYEKPPTTTSPLTIWQSLERYGPVRGPLYGLSSGAPRDYYYRGKQNWRPLIPASRRNIRLTYSVMCLMLFMTSAVDFYELYKIRVDIIETGAYELWRPLYFSLSSLFCFALAISLGSITRNLRIVGLVGMAACFFSWMFYLMDFSSFGGWIIVLIFVPQFWLIYVLPASFLILTSVLSLNLIVTGEVVESPS